MFKSYTIEPVKVSVQLLIPESRFDVPKSDILMTPVADEKKP